MDALKSAGRAIIRSPSLAKQSWGGSKHRKLFFCFSFEIFLQFNSGRKGNKNLLIYASPTRISYCTADKMHDKVFAYIAQSQHNETLECHAFLAQAVTLTVAQAFRVAFEFWQAAKEEKEKRLKSGSDGEVASSSQSESSASLASLRGGGMALFCFYYIGVYGLKIELRVGNLTYYTLSNQAIFCLNINFFFFFKCRLAESRTNPQVLDIGVNPQDFQTECLSPTDWDKADMGTSDRDDIFSF
uniref:Low density lipoprotein receptor adaptor protein 1a n=1 Tax=Erpetoichthys calabaricus TaxID=27687 RepID=A0A8C4XD67_ERPCA